MPVTEVKWLKEGETFEGDLLRNPRIILGGPIPDRYRIEAKKALAENKCPACGAAVKENPEIIGWLQCVNFGNPDINPRCNWQNFID